MSLLLRFRRSHGVERQQIKWFVYAGALTACSAPLSDVFPDIAVLDVLFGVAIGLLPIAAGIAILRYRLYDIDQVIRRTVSYSLLTAVLGAVYAAMVLIAGQVFGGMGGQNAADLPERPLQSLDAPVKFLVTLNRGADVTLTPADLRSASPGTFDVVTANLTGGLLIDAAGRLGDLAQPGARHEACEQNRGGGHGGILNLNYSVHH